MDIDDWTNSEVVQLLEKHIQQTDNGSLEQLHTKIQQITGKILSLSKLRNHLQRFEKQTAAYKQLNDSREHESENPEKKHINTGREQLARSSSSSIDGAIKAEELSSQMLERVSTSISKSRKTIIGSPENLQLLTAETTTTSDSSGSSSRISNAELAAGSNSQLEHRSLSSYQRRKPRILRQIRVQNTATTNNDKYSGDVTTECISVPSRSCDDARKINFKIPANLRFLQPNDDITAVTVTNSLAPAAVQTVSPMRATVTSAKSEVIPVKTTVIPSGSTTCITTERAIIAKANLVAAASAASPSHHRPQSSDNQNDRIHCYRSTVNHLPNGSVPISQENESIAKLSIITSGDMMPQGSLVNQQFQSMTNHLDQCLNAVRMLRNEVVSVHHKIMDGSLANDPNGEKTLEERLDFISQIYDKLESHAKQLPSATPMTVPMERLSRFLHDGQIDPHINELYDKTLEASTWMETNNQLLQMYAEFLRTVVGNRRRSVMMDRPISYSNYGETSSPQSIFEQTLATVLKDPNNKKIGLVGRYLEKSTLSAIVEFKFGQVIDKQYVCLLKMLMVVNSGLPEFVQMIAPHEEWSYLDVGFGQVDIHKESRYAVYRKMSVQANIHLMQTIMPCIDIRNAHTLSYILNLFSKFSGVFDTKCRVCKKIMKDYLPPLMFDLRCPKNALHESCR